MGLTYFASPVLRPSYPVIRLGVDNAYIKQGIMYERDLEGYDDRWTRGS